MVVPSENVQAFSTRMNERNKHHWGRVAGEPEAEVWMACVWAEVFTDLLESGHPRYSQVAVL